MSLEMPKQLVRADFASGLCVEFLSFLKTLQNPDGGWGFHAGEASRVEPTSWAMRALFDSEESLDSENFRRAAAFLHSSQLADGSWPACAAMTAGSWIT